jgi:hypothetical protein
MDAGEYWRIKYQSTVDMNSYMLRFIISKGLSDEFTAYKVALRMDQDILEDLYETQK